MGVFESREEFRWRDRYELIDTDDNDKLLKLMSRVGEHEYIGKEYVCQGADEVQRMERLIDHKILNPSPFLMRLRRVATKHKASVCSSAKVFYLVFEKPFQTVKEECISRKIKGRRFSEDELECILQACAKGLFYLKSIGEAHRNISSSCIFLRQDRTVLLGDPWVLAHPNATNLFDLIYPSPEKILFDNRLIQTYDHLLSDLFALGVVLLECLCLETMDSLYEKGFRRIRYTSIIEKMVLVRSESLRVKLRTLLDHEPTKRKEVFRLCDRKESLQAAFISREKDQFKQHYFENRLEASEVKTVKPVQDDLHTIINKINQSRDHSEFSNVTEPKPHMLRHPPTTAMSATRHPEAHFHSPPPFPPSAVQYNERGPAPYFFPPLQNIPQNTQFHSNPSNNYPAGMRIEQTPKFTPFFQQEGGRVKQPEEHFQQKMSLSSIHQNSSRESEDISNIEIITEPRKEERVAAQPINQYLPSNQRPEIKEITAYPIADSIATPPSQKAEPDVNQEGFMRMNSTIKELSDESPSREDIDLATGEHEIIYETGTRYKGGIRNGKRDGLGTFFYQDGCFYEGEWSQNRMHGKGKLYSQDDKLIYDGSWYMDSFHGRGLLSNLDPTPLDIPFDFYDLAHADDVWQEYEGDFFWDKKHGKGNLMLTNGEVFSGYFDNNQAHGQGKYYRMNGEVVSGVWECGILVGKEQ